MSILNNNSLIGASGQGGGYNLDNSVRLRKTASANLQRIPITQGSKTSMTWSGWIKRGDLSSGVIFASTDGNNIDNSFAFNSDNTVNFINYQSGYVGQLRTTQVFRDTSAWYHFVFVWDTTNATAADRMRIYVNGSRITSFSTATYPAQNTEAEWNNPSYQNRIFAWASNQYPLDGYLAECHYIDGQALTPSSFGEYSTTTGVWQPKPYIGTYGTNGFYLPMNVEGYTAEYLVVGGGGGSGSDSGGGGAGGYIEGTMPFATGSTYTVTVGAGGVGDAVGANSSISTLVSAIGGGYGVGGGSGSNGGSGGGGGNTNGTTNFGVSIQTSPAGGTGYGNSGAAKTGGGGYAGGGGGGAGGGGSASTGFAAGGNGGSGRASSITGSSVTYAGGGGGWGNSSSGSGGSGGGGNGGAGGSSGTNGTANLGGGAGGKNSNGGSGIVVLKILTSNYSGVTTGSPTVTTSGSYTILTYNSSGSYKA